MSAAEYIAQQLDWAQRCFDLTMGTQPEHGPGTPRYDQGITGTICGWQQALLMEIVRKLNPDVADRLADDMEGALDDGGIVAELLYEWRQNLAAGKPISEPASYRTMFDTALGGAA